MLCRRSIRICFASRDRDIDCPGCGYNLRNLCNDRCPECGQQLELGLRLAEPRQAALIAGLVGLAAGAGLGGLLLIYGVIVAFAMDRGGGMLGRFFVINAVGFIAHGVALLMWIRNWNRIRRITPQSRRLLVLVCWAMPLSFVVLFALFIARDPVSRRFAGGKRVIGDALGSGDFRRQAGGPHQRFISSKLPTTGSLPITGLA